LQFHCQSKNAQNAGALAVIIGNVASSVPSNIPPEMGGSDPTIIIPAVSLAVDDANILRGSWETISTLPCYWIER
jgi:hypothetical protein